MSDCTSMNLIERVVYGPGRGEENLWIVGGNFID
jgi:hypothetical protein